MDKGKVVKRLKSLAQLDVDAAHAYEQAIDEIDMPEVRARLQEYRADHQRHYDELSRSIRDFGENPPAYSRDFKGFVIEGMTALRSKMGTEQALKAMRTNEELTNKNYEQAMNEDLPPEVRDVVARGREDERRHLEYIKHAIDNKIWKGEKRPRGRGEHPTA